MLFEGVFPAIDVLRHRLRASPLIRSESGAMAVEFAMVALPFIFMVFATLELAVVLLIFSTLENAMGDAARTIRTGALQNAGGASTATFTNTICTNLGWLQSSCQANLIVDVRSVSQFSDPTLPDPYAGGKFDSSKITFDPGSSGSIVIVRAWYPWTLVVPGLDAGLSRNGDGKALIQATTTFKNEPY